MLDSLPESSPRRATGSALAIAIAVAVALETRLLAIMGVLDEPIGIWASAGVSWYTFTMGASLVGAPLWVLVYAAWTALGSRRLDEPQRRMVLVIATLAGTALTPVAWKVLVNPPAGLLVAAAVFGALAGLSSGAVFLTALSLLDTTASRPNDPPDRRT